MRFLLPEPAGSGFYAHQDRLSHNPIVLTISDRGTTGLGGPLRSDEVPLPGERPDFVNFVRNVGEHKTVELSGGSYRFGKGILYNVSLAADVVVCRQRLRVSRQSSTQAHRRRVGRQLPTPGSSVYRATLARGS